MTLILRAVSLSDPGLVRTNNEDEAHAGGRLIAVADGMGGLPAGEVASRIAITAMAALEWAPTDDAPAVALAGAVAATTRQIRALVDEDPTREGMGTTMTAVLLAGAVLVVAHIGDSRGYLLRGGVLQPLTRDDTFVQELVEQGTLSPAEARRHPQRSLVTRAVQAYDISPAVSTLPAQAGDRLLLCSDGLSDVVDDQVIGQTLVGCSDPRQCAEQLVKLTHQAGAPDNVTVVVADIVAGTG